jgi:hypothetical protein
VRGGRSRYPNIKSRKAGQVISRLGRVLAVALILATPALAQLAGPVPTSTASKALPTTTQSQTMFIRGIPSKTTYVTGLNVVATGASVVAFTAGTGTNCGSGTVALNAPITLAAGSLIAWGTGMGALMIAPQGSDLCVSIGTAAVGGVVSYSQQ